MALVFDNILYLITATFHIGGKEKFEEPANIKVSADMVTVLLPAKHETYEALKQTINSINNQTIVPEIWIILDAKDKTTIKYAKILEKEYQNVRIIVFDNSSKAHALNTAVKYVLTKYVLIIDSGDIFENRDAIENLLKVAEKGYDAVMSCLKAQNTDSWWKKILSYEMNLWTSEMLRRIKRKYGFIPLSGTGLLIRTDALRENPFPETLSEDASLGLKLRNVTITNKSILLYNIPEKLTDHLKQRARWMAGYLQTIPMAKGKEKLIFITPIIQGLVPISWISMFITIGIHLYSFPWVVIDWIAGVYLIYSILNFFIKTRDKISILLPIWWIIIGMSFYKAIEYIIKKRWYYSPKSIGYYEITYTRYKNN